MKGNGDGEENENDKVSSGLKIEISMFHSCGFLIMYIYLFKYVILLNFNDSLNILL